MFRFASQRRTIFSMSRLPLKVENRMRQGQIQSTQRVRIRPNRMKAKNFAIGFLALYGSFYVYSRLVFDPLDKAVTEAAKHLPEEEEDEEELGSIFIPFPGTTKEIKAKPYRGSDPEWQEFIKFSKDQSLAKSVRDELAQFVRHVSDKHPGITLRYGKGIKLRRYWLDVDFPTHAPPEFERSGIEIADDYIAWSTMPVDSEIVFRLRQIFVPSALAQSLWAFTKVMLLDDTRRLARMFGFQNVAPPPSMDQLIAQHQALAKAAGLPTEAGPPKPKQPQILGDSKKTMVPTPVSDKATTTEKGNPEADPEQQLSQLVLGMQKHLAGLQTHFFRAHLAFKQKFAQTWRPAPNYPPRGSILVSGLVELDSPKAWLVFDVKAAWDPKTKAFDPRSMQLKLRRMQMKKQSPLGGS